MTSFFMQVKIVPGFLENSQIQEVDVLTDNIGRIMITTDLSMKTLKLGCVV